jgi:adenylosuccinate lyase
MPARCSSVAACAERLPERQTVTIGRSVGSSPARDFSTIIVNLVQQFNTLLRAKSGEKTFLERISVDWPACRRNFEMQSDRILAEPMYIALQMAGYKLDAHALVNEKAMPLVGNGRTLTDAIRMLIGNGDSLLGEAWSRVPKDVQNMLSNPACYTGMASTKATEVCSLAYSYATSSSV